MKLLSTIILIALICSSCQEKTGRNHTSIAAPAEQLPSAGTTDYLVISDLDDTLKVTHSNNTIAKIWNSLFSERAFSGMSELIQTLTSHSSASYESKKPFAIISGSPQIIAQQIRDFIDRNAFPTPARTFLRKKFLGSETSAEYKLAALSEIADTTTSSFILIGDNTQSDHSVYQQFANKYQGRVLATYIHQVDKTPVPAEQTPFFSSFEIAILEWQAGRLPASAAKAVGNKLLAETDVKTIFPSYAQCPSAADQYPLTISGAPPELEDIFQQVKELLIGHCN